MKHQVLQNCLFDEKCLNGIINKVSGQKIGICLFAADAFIVNKFKNHPNVGSIEKYLYFQGIQYSVFLNPLKISSCIFG